MNQRYHALLQLVDYPTKFEHFAVGDRVIIEGRWRRICALVFDSEASVIRLTDEEENVWTVWVWDLEAEKIPRIPAVLLDIITAGDGDPYR